MSKESNDEQIKEILARVNELGAGPDDLFNLGRRLSRLGVFSGGENPFEDPIAEDLSGEIFLGRAAPSNLEFGLDLYQINRHTLIVGASGSGKTTLIYVMLLQLAQKGINFFTFDFKLDFRHLKNFMGHGLLIFNKQNFRFNPLRPPVGFEKDPKKWITTFVDAFCHAYHLLAASKGVLIDEIDKLFDELTIFIILS
jgi:hypothetical protein